MDGFKRPAKPQRPQEVPAKQPQYPPGQLPPVVVKDESLQDISPAEVGIKLDDANMASPRNKKKWPLIAGAVALFVVVVTGCLYVWYQNQLQPVNPEDESVQKVEIVEGSSLSYVSSKLEERGIIRSRLAFMVLANIQGKQGAMKAGTCNLTPARSAHEVLDKLTTGCHDFKSITFYPGATLETSLYAKTKAANEKKEFKDMSIRASLRAADYSDQDISRAFATTYSSGLFAGKPASEGYEGYIFGETYYVDVNATAEEVLRVAFDHMYEIVKEDELEAKFRDQGLTLYEGITLASIVGRELDCEGKPTEERKERCYSYQRQIAKVFYNRLALGMSLGSDVTSIYASDKLGVESSVDVDSPYNTRRYPGLTPGPIATPGKLALLSVANPAVNDDLYFLAGDDGLIYFAKDEAGHQANITNYCKELCRSL